MVQIANGALVDDFDDFILCLYFLHTFLVVQHVNGDDTTQKNTSQSGAYVFFLKRGFHTLIGEDKGMNTKGYKQSVSSLEYFGTANKNVSEEEEGLKRR